MNNVRIIAAALNEGQENIANAVKAQLGSFFTFKGVFDETLI